MKVTSMQLPGTGAIRTQVLPSKPKREITKITNSQNTKRTYEPHREKTVFLHMRKQGRRSASW